MRNWINLCETTELSEDEVWDKIHNFAEMLERKMASGSIYNEIYGIDTQSYPQLFIAGYPEDGFSFENALAIVKPLAEQLKKGGWILAKQFETTYDADLQDEDEYAGEPQILCYFGWLPINGKIENVSGEELFHICRAEDATSIRSHGLKLSQGGSDFIKTENGRIYAVIGYDNIFDVANDLKKHRLWDSLHVFMIDHERLPDHVWYEDSELPNIGTWTDKPIPASALIDYGDFRSLNEGEVLPFKPKRRHLRHLIEIIKIRTANAPSHPWKVFVNGQYLNGFRNEEQAEKVAADKEKEFDSFYDEANIRLQIMPYRDEFCLLDRGVSIGVFPTAEMAEAKAEEIEAGSVEKMIHAWYGAIRRKP